MTKIFDDPADFADDQLTGFLDLYVDRLRGVHGGVVSFGTDASQVAVVIGGGSGHYPAFCGTVGPGLATGAVVGNIFTSPSAAQAYSVGRAADQGHGVIFSFGNYAGDVMNFGLAADRLRREGIDTRIVLVTDDVASAPEQERRRGIAGDFAVFKIMGAAAAEGHDIDTVERLGQAANAATRSLGVAFSGCTMPGADRPLFTVPDRHLGLGLGIHGEPGIRDVAMMPATELGHLLVDGVIDEAPSGAGRRVAAILNGLGTTKYEELFLLWRIVGARLRARGVQIVEPEVGELVTSLDMGGCSLTLMWLDDDLERLWCADAYTPAYRKSAAAVRNLRAPTAAERIDELTAVAVPAATDAARRVAVIVRAALDAVRRAVVDNETELGRIDAVAGDGDHGRGMRKGVDAAVKHVAEIDADAGGAWLLRRAGRAWAEEAGGTSGVLWGAGLESFGRAVGDSAGQYAAADIVRGVRAFADTVTQLGGAKPGDKTMLDALLPFVDDLESATTSGQPLAVAWQAAAASASTAAEATRSLRPRIGRARPLADKSLGTPDAGATSMALILQAVGDTLATMRGTNP